MIEQQPRGRRVTLATAVAWATEYDVLWITT
jgi:hypothetical protein